MVKIRTCVKIPVIILDRGQQDHTVGRQPRQDRLDQRHPLLPGKKLVRSNIERHY